MVNNPTKPPTYAQALQPKPPAPRQPFQQEIFNEIGRGTHTKARMDYWQSQTNPNECYYHRSDSHTSEKCAVLNGVISKARSNPTQEAAAIPQAMKSQTDDTDLKHVKFLIDELDDSTTPKAHMIDIPQVQDNQWDSNNYYKIMNDDDNSDTDYDNTNNNNTKESVDNYSDFIVDSGADAHMCNSKQYFTTIQHTNIPHVILGDGVTTKPCKGIGTIDIIINHQTRIIIHNVLYVPSLQ